MLFRAFFLTIAATMSIANLSLAAGDPFETAAKLVADRKYNGALTIYSNLLLKEEQPIRRAIIYQEMIPLFIRQRAFDKAGKSLEELKKLIARGATDSIRTKTLFLEGLYNYWTERPTTALGNLENAYTDYLSQGNLKAASNCLIWKGYVEANAFYRFAESIRSYKQALEKYRWPRGEQWAAIQMGLARGYLFSNELTSSSIHGRQAEAYYSSQNKYVAELADCHGLLGVNAIFLGDTAGFFQHTQQAIQLIKNSDENYHLGKYLDNLGAASKLRGACDKALMYYRKALREHVRYQYNTYRISNTYLNIGEYYQDCQLSFDSATYYFRRCLSIRKDNYGSKHSETAAAYQHLGGLFRKHGQFDSALVYFQRALQSEVVNFNSSDIRDNPVAMSDGYGLQLIDILSEKAQSLQGKYNQSGDIGLLQLAFSTLCRADSILVSYRSSMYWQESKLAFSETLRTIYNLAFDCGHTLYEKTNDENVLRKCFYLMENVKYTLLLENIRDGRNVLKARDALLKKTLDDVSVLSQRPEKDTREMAILERRRDSLRILTQQRVDSVASQINFQRLVPQDVLGECVHLLSSEKAGLASYYWSDTTAYCIAVAAGEYTFVRLQGTKRLSEQVRRFKKFISQPPGRSSYNVEWFSQQSQQLFNELLPAGLLKRVEKLVIIPDGPLVNLPFDVLLTASPSADCKGFHCMPYVLHELPTEYWFSFSTVAQTGSSPVNSQEPSVLAFAPVYTGKLAALKGSYDELNGLQTFSQTKILTGSGASKPVFLRDAGQYDVIHIAGHASADTTNGLQSYISFSDHIDDRLYGYEFVDLKLKARLVVLTACETGQGEFKRAEGMYSLGRAFVAAGAESILLSAWTVPDASTADIIKLFYSNLGETNVPAESLRRGKLEFLSHQDELTAHPYFWSSLYFTGHYQNEERVAWNQWVVTIAAIIGTCILIFVSVRKRRR